MNWFSGSIPEAIGLAKSTDAIFVVYVYDSSEASTATDETLAEEELARVLSSKKFVAIRLENGTEGSNQFSQIYPVVLLPSLYFISGSTGMPLEILGGAVTKDKLKEKLDQFTKDTQAPSNNTRQDASGAIEEKMEVEESNSSAAAAAPAPAPVTAAAPDPVTAAAPAPVTAAAPAPVTDNGSVVSDPPKKIPTAAEKELLESMANDGDSIIDNPDISLEERVERAKVMLAEKQAKKAEEKADEERKGELERRKMGQEVAKRKRQMYEEEVQTAARERKKEKDEDRAARERVRAQIAADRLERETRAALLQGEAPAPAQEPSANVLPPAAAPATPSTPAAASSSSNRNASITRLKFRLPDGSSSIAQFPVEATLSEVRQHVEQQLVSSSSFMLTSTVHHRPFNSQDNDASLLDLGLVPSAIIVVLLNMRTSGSGSVIPSQGGIMQFLWILLSPITFLLGFLRQIFSGGSGASQSSSNASSGQDRSSSATPQQRPSTSYGRQRENRLNRDGNIHRLRNTNDEDDNNTWNGNSTQQM